MRIRIASTVKGEHPHFVGVPAPIVNVLKKYYGLKREPGSHYEIHPVRNTKTKKYELYLFESTPEDRGLPISMCFQVNDQPITNNYFTDWYTNHFPGMKETEWYKELKGE